MKRIDGNDLHAQATQESAVEAARRAVETSRAAGEQRAARRERWHSRSSSAPPNRRVGGVTDMP